MRRVTPKPQMPLGSARLPPPHFAGRKPELALLNQGLDYLLQTGDPSGGIVLITGVPGIGKTQLARRFTDDAKERHKGVVSCGVETSVLESPVSLLMDMAKRLDSAAIARRAADMDSRSTGGAIDVARLFSRSRTKEHVRHTPSFGTLLRESADAGMWRGCSAMVLVVDELQTVTPEGMKTLRVLHEGNHGCPIHLLGVGLQHTPFVLGSPGGRDTISRPNEPICLGPLSRDETVEAVAKGLEKQGHDVPAESAQALADAAQGFPHHVHGYLAGAVLAIAEHGHLDRGAALASALAAGHKHREAYYDMIADKMGPDRSVIHPVVKLMRDRKAASLTHEEATRAVSAGGSDGTAVVWRAIEHGVLKLNKGEVSFGIPSFHAYMQQSLSGAEALARQAQRGGVGQ